MKALPLLALLPLSLLAQNTIPSGVYKAKNFSNDLELRLNEDNSYDLVLASGKYTMSDKKIYFSTKGNSFSVEKKQGDSEQLQLVFKTALDTHADPRYIYIGYEKAKGEVEYVCLYNKISLDNIQDTKDENGITYYVLETIEIPRTQHLYLVNAYGAQNDKNKEVRIEKYPIGKETNSLEISVLDTKGIRLGGVYNAEKNTLAISEGDNSRNSIVFAKENQALGAAYINSTNTERVKNWKHLIAFDEENDIPEYNPEKEAKKVSFSTLKSLKSALNTAASQQRVLIVFQQPENANAKEEFKRLLEYVAEDYENNKVLYYLATAKEAKELKAKGVPAGNQMVVLDSRGDLLYYEPNTVGGISSDYYEGYGIARLEDVALARQLDRVLGNPKAPLKEVQQTFLRLLRSEYPMISAIAKNHPTKTAKIERTEDNELAKTEDYDEDEGAEEKRFLDSFNNQDALYRMKLTPEALEAQWNRMVEAHTKDSKLDAGYAAVIALNNTEDYYKKAFGEEATPNESQLKAIAYLLKFHKEIETHNKKLFPKKGGGYEDSEEHTYRERLDNGGIEVNYNQLPDVIASLGYKDDKMLPQVKALYEEGVRKQLFDMLDYIDFLYEVEDKEVATYFADYFKKLQEKDSHLIAALDKEYSQKENGYSWKYYKMRFANRANNVAWKVYQLYKDDLKALAAPYQWAKAAVQIEPENPYYIDTLAHLMYAHGEKKEAIKLEEKAVELLSKSDDGNEEERAEVKANLEKMKRHN